jgi:hypothetical protein
MGLPQEATGHCLRGAALGAEGPGLATTKPGVWTPGVCLLSRWALKNMGRSCAWFVQ